MGKRTNRKLSVKKETMRKLGALTEDQLRAAAGGTVLFQTLGCSVFCAGIRTGGGTIPTGALSCDTRCEFTMECP